MKGEIKYTASFWLKLLVGMAISLSVGFGLYFLLEPAEAPKTLIEFNQKESWYKRLLISRLGQLTHVKFVGLFPIFLFCLLLFSLISKRIRLGARLNAIIFSLLLSALFIGFVGSSNYRYMLSTLPMLIVIGGLLVSNQAIKKFIYNGFVVGLAVGVIVFNVLSAYGSIKWITSKGDPSSSFHNPESIFSFLNQKSRLTQEDRVMSVHSNNLLYFSNIQPVYYCTSCVSDGQKTRGIAHRDSIYNIFELNRNVFEYDGLVMQKAFSQIKEEYHVKYIFHHKMNPFIYPEIQTFIAEKSYPLLADKNNYYCLRLLKPTDSLNFISLPIDFIESKFLYGKMQEVSRYSHKNLNLSLPDSGFKYLYLDYTLVEENALNDAIPEIVLNDSSLDFHHKTADYLVYQLPSNLGNIQHLRLNLSENQKEEILFRGALLATKKDVAFISKPHDFGRLSSTYTTDVGFFNYHKQLISTTGFAGFLQKSEPLFLEAGSYEISWIGKFESIESRSLNAFCFDQRREVSLPISQTLVVDSLNQQFKLFATFSIEDDIPIFQYGLKVDADSDLTLRQVFLKKQNKPHI